MTEKTYQWDASDYAKHSSAQFEWARELIGKLKLRGDEDLIDIGCGDGRISMILASSLDSGSVTAVDSSQEMIDLARRNYPSDLYPNLTFLRMDAREIEFSDRFHLAFSNASLHWIQDHTPVLEGVKRCLKPCGKLLFQMGGKGNAGGIAPVFLEVISQESWKQYFDNLESPYAFFGTEEYEGFLRRAGLEPIRVELVPKVMRQRGKKGVAGWIRTTWLPFLERVPYDQRETFVSEIVEGYCRIRPPDEDGRIHLDMIRLEVEARKPT